MSFNRLLSGVPNDKKLFIYKVYNEIIDDFIHKCQILSSLPMIILEWIPFDQFINVKKLTEGGFSSIYYATWTRGYLCDCDEDKKEFSYSGPQGVVLKNLNNSSSP